MTKKQNSGRITIANIISIVGLVLLFAFTFLGRSYMSGGEIGFDILISVAITGVTAFLLWFLIKAKGAENSVSKWKIAEYVALGVYVIFAIWVTFCGGIMQFFVVNDKKEEIKDHARSDLVVINSMFEDYKNFESDALAKTATGLANAKRDGMLCDEDLNKFMRENSIETLTSVDNYKQLQRNDLLGSGFEDYYKRFKDNRYEITAIVDSWSVVQIPFKAKEIEEIAKDVSKQLTKLSQQASLPVVENNGTRYVIKEYQRKEFSFAPEKLKFKKHLAETSGFSLAALAVVIVINLMILFNYFVAYRTNKVAIGKNNYNNDGGIILN